LWYFLDVLVFQHSGGVAYEGLSITSNSFLYGKFRGENNMTYSTSVPSFDELASSIAQGFAALRAPYMQWANLARRAVQGLPHDARRLAELEAYINARREELRKAVVVASEHLTEKQLEQVRDRAQMSKYAWRSFKKMRPVTIRYGFTLVSY